MTRAVTRSLCLFLPALLSGCASTGSDGEPVEFPSIEGKFAQVAVDDPDTVGYLMTQLDQNVQAWSNLKGGARTEEEERKLRGIESWIRGQVRLHLGDVIEQLESGPRNNRAVAAVALGFSQLEEAQSPLLNALEDPDPLVVGNALLGLGKLAMPDTPLAQLCYRLRFDPDPAVRRNAAYALKCIAEAGGWDECAVESARDALTDAEPSVRGMAAVTLALIGDAESLQALNDLLYDEEDFVFAAAATSIAEIGRSHEAHTGEAARILVAVFGKGDKDRRWRVQYELSRLRGENLGEEVEAWRDWAYRIP
ncbi:MAG: HEAT repeat domain-containing protein [Planctomycetota bacterium]|jgi:hypothetical protein